MSLILFFGNKDPQYGLLSNFAQCPFISTAGPVYTSEQLFMMFKAQHFGDKEAFEELKTVTEPKTAKAIGRRVKRFSDAEWDRVRYQYMCKALMEKFSCNSAARAVLMSTNNALLAEASPFDTIWGIGYGKSNPLASTGPWRGQNLLGKALMVVREQLR